MARVCLVNPPFAAIRTPSLALTQLRSALEKRLGGRVEVEIHYLNLEIAKLMGDERYRLFAADGEGQSAGLGEWIFGRAAFPDAQDRDEEYFERYFPDRETGARARRRALEALRDSAEDRLLDLVEERGLHRAEVVGMTSMFFQTTASLSLARRIKEISPKTVTVLGGANCESPMGEEIARRATSLDFVVSGPGLVMFPQLVRRLLDADEDGCHSLPGVFSRQNLSTAPPPAAVAPELPLDAEIDLDYDTFLEDLERCFPEAAPHLLFETSRGCWWGAKAHCTFCGLNGSTMTHRAMSPGRALAQFERLFRYWPRCEYFECVDNLMPQEYLRDVFPRLRAPEGATIFYEVKASLTGDQLEMLSDAGVRRMQAGIESLSTDTLRLMKKGTTSFQNVTFLMHCLRCEIEPIWNLLVGFPGEAEEAYVHCEASVPLLAHLPPPTGVYTVRFDRYSPYHVRAEDYGLALRPYDFYELVFPFPPEALENLAYYFMDHAIDSEYLTVAVRWMERLRAAVGRWRRAWEAAPPILRFVEADTGALIDTRRPGREARLDVGASGRRILDSLTSPHDLQQLARSLGRVADRSLEREVERLTDRGLLFREGERMLSLVLPAHVRRATDEPSLERLDRSAHKVRRGELSRGQETGR